MNVERRLPANLDTQRAVPGAIMLDNAAVIPTSFAGPEVILACDGHSRRFLKSFLALDHFVMMRED